MVDEDELAEVPYMQDYIEKDNFNGQKLTKS